MITKEALRDAITTAKAKNATLCIRGYKSSSGQILDYKLKIPEDSHEFYLGLVKESIQAMTDGKIPRPLGVEPSVWKEACMSKLVSWNKTINGEQEQRESHEKLAKVAGLLERDDGVIVLSNCELVESKLVKESDTTRQSKELTIAKQKVASMSPLSKLSPRLNLTPDKVEDVWVEDTKD